MSDEPNGHRDASGRFLPGCPGGPGHPGKHANAWRVALAEVATPERIKEVIKVLFREADKGRSWAIKELLDRGIGRAAPEDIEASNGSEPQIIKMPLKGPE